MLVLNIVLGILFGVSIAIILLLVSTLKDVIQDNNGLIKENEGYRAELYEHKIIFEDNLGLNYNCYTEAIEALNDVYDVLEEVYSSDWELFSAIEDIEVKNDRVYDNKYDHRAGTITVSLFRDAYEAGEQHLYEYINKNYGVNLDSYDVRTHIIFTVLHEFGHHVDYISMKRAGLYKLYDESDKRHRTVTYTMEYGPKMWEAYRQIPAEIYADKFAIEFMREHFPELV